MNATVTKHVRVCYVGGRGRCCLNNDERYFIIFYATTPSDKIFTIINNILGSQVFLTRLYRIDFNEMTQSAVSTAAIRHENDVFFKVSTQILNWFILNLILVYGSGKGEEGPASREVPSQWKDAAQTQHQHLRASLHLQWSNISHVCLKRYLFKHLWQTCSSGDPSGPSKTFLRSLTCTWHFRVFLFLNDSNLSKSLPTVFSLDLIMFFSFSSRGKLL